MTQQQSISFRIPGSLVGALDHEAQHAGVSRAEMARALIAHTLATDVSRALEGSHDVLQDRSQEQLVDIVQGLAVALPSALALLAASPSSRSRTTAQALGLELIFAVDWIAYGQARPDLSEDRTAKIEALKARVAALLDGTTDAPNAEVSK